MSSNLLDLERRHTIRETGEENCIDDEERAKIYWKIENGKRD